MRFLVALTALLSVLALAAPAQDKLGPPRQTKFRLLGLFAPDRELDLRAVIAKIKDVKLLGVDYKYAEITLEYPAKRFGEGKPEQIAERVDGELKGASSHTFGVKVPSTVPRDKLQLVEIPAYGLDCKACALAAYESVARLDGVEAATASFRDSRVTALIDPTKTDRSKLEAALTQIGVSLKAP